MWLVLLAGLFQGPSGLLLEAGVTDRLPHRSRTYTCSPWPLLVAFLAEEPFLQDSDPKSEIYLKIL